MIYYIFSFSRIAILLIFSFVLAGCDSSNAQVSTLKIDQVEKHQSGWPRTIMTSQGLVTLAKPPNRIVSTSVSLSGTLLSINAPLVASGATAPNTSVASESGFFRQWSVIAKQRGVTPLYQQEPDAEAIIQAKPDVIIISAMGGDSAMKLYDQLKDVAPTVVIRYDNKDWMQLANIFGELFGLEAQAQRVIEDFKQQLMQTKKSLVLPPQPTTALVYYQDSTMGGNIWTEESAQGRLLLDLGFTLAPIPESIKGDISMGIRDDIVIATGERFPDAITGNSVLLFSSSDKRAKTFTENNYLSLLGPVKNNLVFAVGEDNFRLDYYSASNLLTRLQLLFGQNTHHE